MNERSHGELRIEDLKQAQERDRLH